jgi:hypothetical protein
VQSPEFNLHYHQSGKSYSNWKEKKEGKNRKKLGPPPNPKFTLLTMVLGENHLNRKGSLSQLTYV